MSYLRLQLQFCIQLSQDKLCKFIAAVCPLFIFTIQLMLGCPSTFIFLYIFDCIQASIFYITLYSYDVGTFLYSEFFKEPINIPSYLRTTENSLVIIYIAPLQTLKERQINTQCFRNPENRVYTSRRCVNILIKALYTYKQFKNMDQLNKAQGLIRGASKSSYKV